MTDYVHGFEGGTNGATITNGSFPPDNNFNTVTAPTGTAWTFSTTGKITGSLGGRVTTSASAWRAYDQFNGTATLAGRVGFTFNGTVINSITIVDVIEGTGFSASVRVGVSSIGKLVVQNAAGTILVTSTAALVAGTAYYVEIQVNVGTTATAPYDGAISAQLYTAADPGTPLAPFPYTGTAVNAGAGKNLTRGQLGDNAVVAALDLTFDDVLWRPGTTTPVGSPATNASPAATLYAAGTTGFPAVTAAGSSNASASASLYAAGATGFPAVTAAANVSVSGPDYAGSAADLGNGSGSWVNPGNATGTNDDTYASWTVP